MEMYVQNKFIFISDQDIIFYYPLGFCLEASGKNITMRSCSNFPFGCPGKRFRSTEINKCKD